MGPETLFVVGAGRMGRGIALSYSIAGASVILVDIKDRPKDEFEKLSSTVTAELSADIEQLRSFGVLSKDADVLARVEVLPGRRAEALVASARLIYEAVPETMPAKQAALEWIGQHAAAETTVASTTSTLNVEELAGLMKHPERFLNAHWLNPAHLMPLVEVSVGQATANSARDSLIRSLKAIGKIGVVCSASPGYIVPRIQALAMNEAARLVEEGVASAEDIDTAIRVGFGLRFAVLGLLEFIDWGGNDILYYASQHLSRTVNADRYAVPEIIAHNMEHGKNGVREGVGFYDYSDMDVPAYRRNRMEKFVGLLAHLDLLPAGLHPAKP